LPISKYSWKARSIDAKKGILYRAISYQFLNINYFSWYKL
jgi:hypothetical protein